MDRTTTQQDVDIATTLLSLAEGADPLTGEPIADDSLLQRPDIIRALFKAAAVLGGLGGSSGRAGPRAPKRPRGDLPEGAGKAWSAEEEQRLVASFDAGRKLAELAADHTRTRGAIRARLIKLGKIEADWIPMRRG